MECAQSDMGKVVTFVGSTNSGGFVRVGILEERGWIALTFCGSAALHTNLIKLCGKRGCAVAEHAYDQKESNSASTTGY